MRTNDSIFGALVRHGDSGCRDDKPYIMISCVPERGTVQLKLWTIG